MLHSYLLSARRRCPWQAKYFREDKITSKTGPHLCLLSHRASSFGKTAFNLVPHPIVAKKGEQAAIRIGATLARTSIQAPPKTRDSHPPPSVQYLGATIKLYWHFNDTAPLCACFRRVLRIFSAFLVSCGCWFSLLHQRLLGQELARYCAFTKFSPLIQTTQIRYTGLLRTSSSRLADGDLNELRPTASSKAYHMS